MAAAQFNILDRYPLGEWIVQSPVKNHINKCVLVDVFAALKCTQGEHLVTNDNAQDAHPHTISYPVQLPVWIGCAYCARTAWLFFGISD